MTTVRFAVLAGFACAGLTLLSACARESQDQMSWARAALERNGQLEVVAADPQSHTFTVRVKDTGEVRTVRADEVMAAPLAAAVPSAAPAAAGAAATAAPNSNTNTAASGEPASAAPPAAETPAPEAAEALPPSSTPPPAPAVARVGTGHVIESGPGYSIEAASGAQATLMQSGPGYSVKAAPAAVAGSGARARLRDAGVTSAALERRREPIVCQGARMLHIDNRNLEFDGDAVSAEDGCEIYITNSHISATGVGVLARNANVHIDNSLIEGDAGSIDASEGAQVFATYSQFRGLSRRLDSATFHDQGGNIWN
jgi:hypothetical protein